MSSAHSFSFESPEEFIDIRCRGCGRLLGISTRMVRGYCDARCAGDFPVSGNEDRDSLIDAIRTYVAPTTSSSVLAAHFGITRQRIEQLNRS